MTLNLRPKFIPANLNHNQQLPLFFSQQKLVLRNNSTNATQQLRLLIRGQDQDCFQVDVDISRYILGLCFDIPLWITCRVCFHFHSVFYVNQWSSLWAEMFLFLFLFGRTRDVIFFYSMYSSIHLSFQNKVLELPPMHHSSLTWGSLSDWEQISVEPQMATVYTTFSTNAQ